MQCKGEKSRGFLVELCRAARVYREASARALPDGDCMSGENIHAQLGAGS
jgi:hypothetical protein